jgi:hypothetical protein
MTFKIIKEQMKEIIPEIVVKTIAPLVMVNCSRGSVLDVLETVEDEAYKDIKDDIK